MFAILGSLAALVPACALGRIVLERRTEPAVVGFAVGAALWSTILFFAFQFGVARWWTIAPLGVAICVIGLRGRWTWPQSWHAALLAPYLVLYLVHALAPEVEFDAMSYHLGLAAEWARDGAFAPRTGYFEVMPHGIEVLFAVAFWVGKHSAAKLVHLAFLVGSVPLMVAIAKRLGFDGGPAAAFYLFTPVAGVCGTSAFVDAGLAFFALAAFYFMLAAEQERDPRLFLLAGVCAGFCYSVKLTGIVVPAAASAWLLLRGRWLAAAASIAMMAPWMIRAVWMSGNPLAPVANGIFRNPYFHLATQRTISDYVSSYGLGWSQIPFELALGGSRLQGMLGPMWLLAPVGLLAFRRKLGWSLWLAAGVAIAPWLFNFGARFLIPALPFLALAMAIVAGRRMMIAIAVLHGALSWPAALDVYARGGSWFLKGFPWRAALGVESEQAYLRSHTAEYPVAEAIARHTKRGDRILDLVGTALSYFEATALSDWQYPEADRAADALRLAFHLERGSFYELSFEWPELDLTALKLEQTEAGPEPWSIQEIRLIVRGEALFPSQNWTLDAEPNPWEAPLALDRNGISRWQSWEPRRPGMFYQVEFGAGQKLDGVRLTCAISERAAKVRISGKLVSGEWRALSRSPNVRFWTALDLRHRAAQYVKREGFQYVLIHTGSDGYGPVGKDILSHLSAWGIEQVAMVNGIYVLRIR